MSLASARLEFALGGSYYDVVLDNGPGLFCPLNEQLAATGARDRSGFGNHGVYAGGLTFGTHGPFPHGGTAVAFNGTTGHVDFGDLAVFEFTDDFTIECVVKFTGAAAQYFISKRDTTAFGGWALYASGGSIAFYADSNAGAVKWSVVTDAAYNDGEWHHVVATWDGTTGTNKAAIYVDGVLVKQGDVGLATLGNRGRLLIGASDSGSGVEADFLGGSMAGGGLYFADLTAAQVLIHAQTRLWTANEDADGDVGLSWQFGINGNTPLARLPSPGPLTFDLVSETEGLYSPHHPDRLENFGRGMPVRVVLVDDSAVEHIRFWGQLMVVDAEPGIARPPRVHCVCQDYAWVLVENTVRSLPIQINQADDDLVRVVLEALPNSAQPMAVDLGVGEDIFPVAFDTEQSRSALAACDDPVISAWAKLTVHGDGTLAYRTRVDELIEPSAYEFGDDEIKAMAAPSTLDNVFNDIRVTAHPKIFGSVDTEVIYAATEVIEIPAGATIVREFEYTDPSNRNQQIGGTDFQDPLVENTDYDADTAADGSGSDISADIDIVAVFSGARVQLTITNTNVATAYLVDNAGTPTLQVRGRGIYDQTPVVAVSSSGNADRPFELDARLLGSGASAQGLAEYIKAQYEALERQVNDVSFEPHDTDDLMDQALLRNPGDVVTVMETRTGLEVQLVIQLVRLTLKAPFKLSCSFGVGPKLVGYPGILDDPDYGTLDEKAVLAYG